ncbi:MAG TPA: SUMF1/EgtB/PvdO family nonheme iron enzyme [Xylella sp.]
MGLCFLSLTGCVPTSEPASPKVVAAPPSAPPVSVDGPESFPKLARWESPPVVLGDVTSVEVRRRAAQALAEDRLYRSADDAIPLYLALRTRSSGRDRAAEDGLRRALVRLLALADALLLQPEVQEEALEQARDVAMVALSLAPQDQRVRHLQRRIETAQHVLAFNLAGEDDLRAGRLGESRHGALGHFRDALRLDPDNVRACQGLAAVESAMIRHAEQAADASNFDSATRWLGFASAVREQAPTVTDARVRIMTLRIAKTAAWRDAALRAISDPKKLKDARALFAEISRIAPPGDTVVSELQERINRATHYGRFRRGQVFTDAMQDGTRGPQMVVVPYGAFQMGAGDTEAGASAAERPRHYVRFERGFAMSITEVTVAQFRRFVEHTGYRPRATRRGHSLVYDERSGNFVRRSGVDWQSGYDGRAAGPNDPVMHVSVRDAEAYAAWMSRQTGRYYHLPSEAEFEYALRAGREGYYPWGNAAIPVTGNYTGGNDASPSGRRWANAFIGYGDGYWGVAPVASFQANPWGLHDMGGNLSEWVADCWHSSYRRAPVDGIAWYNPGCRQRLVRGGSWANSPQQTRAAWRGSQDSDMTSARIGFRLGRGI